MDRVEPQLFTTRKRPLLLNDDRLYRQEKINHDNRKVYYICRSCQVGRICSDEEGQVSETISCEENCEKTSFESRVAEDAVKRLYAFCSTRMDMSLQDCYNEKRQELSVYCPEAAATHFPAFINIRSTMARERNKNIPPIPTNYATIPSIDTFPVLYTRNLLLDRQFLFLNLNYYPEGVALPIDEPPFRVLAFMRDSSAHKLCASERIFLDGTFKVCPIPFQQLFTKSTMRGTGDR